MAHSPKVNSIIPTNLFTDGDYYYGLVGNMILRTEMISYAVFHTLRESPAVSALLTKYGIAHKILPSTRRAAEGYVPIEERNKIQMPIRRKKFSIEVNPRDMITYRADIIKFLKTKTQLSCQH